MSAAAIFVVFVVAFWVYWVWSRDSKLRQVEDRPDLPYHAYTTAHDVVCAGGELQRVLEDSGSSIQPGRLFRDLTEAELRSGYFDAYRAAMSGSNEFKNGELRGLALVLLVDQSGSLADQMASVAGHVRACAERIEKAGASVLVAGFTTVGWRGGKSRREWSQSGRPQYPGRLCDLLHVIYSPFEERISEDNLRPMFSLGAMYENVDGEALRWARSQLAGIDAVQKVIVVVSDGAPVDDSTLSENGPAFLERDILSAINELENDEEMELGAVGIGFEVSRYYVNAATADPIEQLSPCVLGMVRQLAA